MENILNISIYKDGNNTIVVFKETTREVEDIIKGVISAVSNQEMVETEVEHLEALPAEEDTTPSVPAFMQEVNVAVDEPVNHGAHVIMDIKKYAGKGKTVAEVFSTDEQWLRWVANNFTPRNETAKKDVEAIKSFLASM